MALPFDLTTRIQRRIRASVTRARYSLGAPTLSIGDVRLSRTFNHPIDAHRRSEIVSRYRSTFPEAASTELREANRLLDHHFRLLGHTMDHGPRIAWLRDPVSGEDWRRTFSADIPYRGPERLGDIKLPWELAKQQYFFTLGKAAWLAENPAFAHEIVAQIDQWIADNPCHEGIHWISALESGTRALSWILSYPFFQDVCDEAFRDRLARSIVQHLLFIEENLSTGQFANTHLAGEAAILVAGGMFIDHKKSTSWISMGLQHLETQISRQVHADGAHAEQSIAYHRFFLDQYYLVHAVLEANGYSFSPQVYRRIEQMTAFLMDVLFPDGSAPAFGDCDDARGIWCQANSPKEYRSLLALGSVLSGRGDFKHVSTGPTEEVLWLFGPEGLDRFAAIPAQVPTHSGAGYADAGYYIMRGGWQQSDSMLVFDCGPLGHGPAGHGHADALSFQLFHDGYPFLVDPGSYSYNLDYQWRDVFRSTRAHNTIVIDGVDQSVPRDRMAWQQAAESTCRRWTTTPWFDLVDATHSGYLRLADPVSHRRILVFLKPDVWFIYDLLNASGKHELEMLLQVRPDCSAIGDGPDGLVELRSPYGQQLFVHGAFERRSGDDGAWYSPEYGRKVPTSGLAHRRVFQGTTALLTGFSSHADTGFEAHAGPDALYIAPKPVSNRTSMLFCGVSADAKLSASNLVFHGELLYRDEPVDSPETIRAENFTVLAVTDSLEVRSPTPILRLEMADGQAFITITDQAVGRMDVRASPGLSILVNGRRTT